MAGGWRRIERGLDVEGCRVLRWFTVNEICADLKISKALVYQMVESGELPCYRLGGKGRRGTIRVSEADLAEFLKSRKVTHERPAPAARAKPVNMPVLQNLRLKPS
jgi:excisionase family DNA binding protein